MDCTRGTEGTIYGKLHCFLAGKQKGQILPECPCSYSAGMGAGVNHCGAGEHSLLVQSQLSLDLPQHNRSTKPVPGLQTSRSNSAFVNGLSTPQRPSL